MPRKMHWLPEYLLSMSIIVLCLLPTWLWVVAMAQGGLSPAFRTFLAYGTGPGFWIMAVSQILLFMVCQRRLTRLWDRQES